MQTYHELPDQIADVHSQFEQFISVLQTNFKHLKEATSRNTQNLQTDISLQQAYTSTLGPHNTTMYSKITELQNQIQQHCMYSHSNNHSNTDTVQLEALDYDLDIDGNSNNTSQNPKVVTVSINDTIEDEQSIPKLLDASSPEPNATTYHLDPSKTNWPDAPTIQIPQVSLTNMEAPPKVVYHHRTTVYTADRQQVVYLKSKKMNMSRNMIIAATTS